MSKTIIENLIASWEIGGGLVGTRSYMNEIRDIKTHELIESWVEVVIEEPTAADCWDGDDFQLG